MEILCPADAPSPAPGRSWGALLVRETAEAGAAFVCGVMPKGRAALASLRRCSVVMFFLFVAFFWYYVTIIRGIWTNSDGQAFMLGVGYAV